MLLTDAYIEQFYDIICIQFCLGRISLDVGKSLSSLSVSLIFIPR